MTVWQRIDEDIDENELLHQVLTCIVYNCIAKIVQKRKHKTLKHRI